ncbi:asparagine synthase (glutamine-hydrolyzing) [Aureimonas leprariae]|nr:asparagine synthase (glutamine-hydrolyzing) [Aureimonas leprariae]
MCGISGIAWLDASRPAGIEEVRRMNAAIRHRGPDGGGIFSCGPVVLGHRRLSILDLSDEGQQPMVFEEDGLALTFNGEIYNYIELREELRGRGVRFRSQSDTEVLLAAYRHWGADCVQRFNGMWAFAIHDRRRNVLFASRDRFGIKPFYFTVDAGRFAFASEIKALLAAFPELRRPDHGRLRHFLPTGLLDDDAGTVFADVRQLEPAQNLRLDLATGSLTTERYWDVQPEAFRDRWAGTDPVEVLRELLGQSVDLHMRSDVPVGICLSGGVDSSALLSLMAARSPTAVHAYSGLYEGKDYDESSYARAARARAGATGAEITQEPSGDLLDTLARITWHQDMPSAGPGLYTQFNVMRRASTDVKVVLDGQGADELFAGYLYYYGLRVDDLAGDGSIRQSLAAHRLAASVVRHFGPRGLGTTEGPAALRAAKALRTAALGLEARFRPHAAGAAAPPFFADMPAGDATCGLDSPYLDRLSRRLHEDLASRSIPALLHYEDRNSMAFSIEARVPFLDVRLVEFALGLDPAFKIRDSWTKWVLRRAAEPLLPPQIAWRRSKFGYPTPAARWMRRGADRDRLADLLFSQCFRERGLATPASLDFYWRQHQAGTVDRSWLLWRYATVELWFRHFIDAFEPMPANAARGPDDLVTTFVG